MLFSFQTKAKDIALEYYWGFIEKAKAKGVNIHYADDYFLYLSVFEKNEELQKYFIEEIKKEYPDPNPAHYGVKGSSNVIKLD